MLKPILFIAAIGCVFDAAHAQCEENDEVKVLLVGDSWAFFMGVDQTIDRALQKWGHSDHRFLTNLIVAENGAETDDFLQSDKQDEIQQLIDDNPSIEVIHLSIGGNDVLGDWNINFTTAQTDSLRNAVMGRLIGVIDFLKSTKPGIRILWSGYAYPNFGEVIGELPSFLQSVHPFYGTWEGMGFPTFAQLNPILNDFSAAMQAYADTDPQVEFVSATGLMQYTHGQADPLAVAPGGTYAALTVPLPTGDPSYPSPKSAMRDYGITRDCFHLSPRGYDDLVEYHTQKFYHKFFMNDQYLLSQGGTNDGSISSTGTSNATLVMGSATGVGTAAVVSFNTTAMTGLQVAEASLFLRRASLVGANPISGALQIQVKSGHFGSTAELEADDWGSSFDASGTACLFGSNGGDGHWIRLDLPDELLPFITPGNTTQFMLADPNGTEGSVTFNSAADPDFAPVLDLTFEPLTVGSAEIARSRTTTVHPNPTDGLLFFDQANGTVLSADVLDMLGRFVLRSNTPGSILDLSALPEGIYTVQLHYAVGASVQRVIKR